MLENTTVEELNVAYRTAYWAAETKKAASESAALNKGMDAAFKDQPKWGDMALPICNTIPSGEDSFMPLAINEIKTRTRARTGDWPRKTKDGKTFVDVVTAGGKHDVQYLKNAASLFGWLGSQVGIIPWKRDESCVSKVEFFEELSRTAMEYESIERFPHFPPKADSYYACSVPSPGNGEHLAELVSRFTPATNNDRMLIVALIVTLFWGGPGGARPVFAITSNDGRGVGKSLMTELAGRLAGGILDIDAGQDMSVVRTRLLSAEGRYKRLVRWDNVKTHNLSWAEYEVLITGFEVSGRQLYVGEGTRLNDIVYAITLNAPSLSTDMAQRAVMVYLSSPKRSGNWQRDIEKYIKDHREHIIADIAGFLMQPKQEILRPGRWAVWEAEVLSRFPNANAIQQMILERQAAVDSEKGELGVVEDHIAESIDCLGFNSLTDKIAMTPQRLGKFFSEATGDKVSAIAAGKKISQAIDEGSTKRFSRQKRTNENRGMYVWEGKMANSDTKVITTLEAQIKTAKDTEDEKKRRGFYQ